LVELFSLPSKSDFLRVCQSSTIKIQTSKIKLQLSQFYNFRIGLRELPNINIFHFPKLHFCISLIARSSA
jgi:hypothetical protein